MMKRYFGAVALLCALSISLCAQNTTTFGNIVSQGTPCGSSNCVYYQLPPATHWVSVTVTGTWIGTLETAVTSAPNANYSNLSILTWTPVATTTANGTWTVATSGSTYLRVRATSWTSGLARVAMDSTLTQAPLTNPVFPGGLTAGGLMAPSGGSSANCWTTIGGSLPCGGGNLPSNAPFVSTLNNGAVGVSLPADTDNFIDPTFLVENGGVLDALYGITCRGDSNGQGFGLIPGQLSWCGNIYADTNNGIYPVIGSGWFGQDDFSLAGDAYGDASNRAIMMDAIQESGNPVAYVGLSTNNYICCTGITPPTTAQQVSIKAQAAAVYAWETASNTTDKFLPSSQVATATSYVVQGNPASIGNNVVIVQAQNQYIPYQNVVLGNNGSSGTNFTTTPLSTLNGTVIQILPTNLSPTQYSFAAGALAVTASQSDTGTATPTNIFTQTSGTWALAEPIFDFSFVSGGGGNQGINYQIGDVLQLPCAISNAKLNVVSVATLGITGVTLNLTTSGGVITAITLANGGTGVAETPQLGFISGGGGTGGYFNITAQTGGVVTAVTLMQGGTGYSNTSAAATTFTGELANSSLTVNTLGAGCAPAVAAATAIGGSGFGFAINTSVGPAMYTTSTGGTLSSPPTSGINAIYVPKGGDVEVIYPAGPLFGGTFQFLSDGVALTDSSLYTGLSTITENYATNTGPRNFPTKVVFQLAHFKVAAGFHQFSIVCASGNLCGVMAVIVPTGHNGGVNGPNLTVAGGIPEGSSSQPSCGLTLPQSCTSFFSSMFQAVVQDIASAGQRVKYADNQNIDGTLDFVNNGTAGPFFGVPLIQNRYPNTTNALHMAESGHRKFANNVEWASKVIPAPLSVLTPTVLDATGTCSTSMSCWPKFGTSPPANTFIGPGILTGYSQTGGMGRYAGITDVPSAFMGAGGSAASSAQVFIAPVGDAQVRGCNYILGSGFGTAPNIFGINNWSQAQCWLEFQDNFFNLLFGSCVATVTTTCPSASQVFRAESFNTAVGVSRVQHQLTFSGVGAAAAMEDLWQYIPSAQAPGTAFSYHLNNVNGGLQYLWNAPSTSVLALDQSGIGVGKTQYWQGNSGSLALDLLFSAAPKANAPFGVVTFSAATGASAPTCVSTTCTNKRGKISIVATTATTGPIGTVNFSAALSAAPFCTVTEKGFTVVHGLDNGAPTTVAFTVTAAVSVASSTVLVDYFCQP